MNTPLLLTSVALLAGVAARPIENDRRGDDLRELVRSPDNDDRPAFMGRIPSGFNSLNSLQLHDLHDNTHSENDAEANGSRSPKLTGTDSLSDPDPGLDSPYMGPQHYLVSIEQELISPALTPDTPTSSPAPAGKTEQVPLGSGEPDYSPMVVIMVLSSMAALVLVGLAVAAVYVTQLLRRTVLKEDVWRSIAGGRGGEKGGMNWSEKEKVGQRVPGKSVEAEERGGGEQGGGGIIIAREVPRGELSDYPTLEPTKPSETSVDDPDVMSLPESIPASAPAVRDRNREHNMGLALVGWTYDNWVTHFMMALFGWLGVFFGGTNDHR